MPLHLYAPCMFVCPLYICTPPGVCMLPYVPHTPLCICMFSELLHIVEVVKCPLTCWTLLYTSPCMGVPPLQVTPPLICWLPCASVCSGISVCHMGIFPYLGDLEGVPHLLGGLGHQHIACPYALLYIFVVHCLMFLWLKLLLLQL